MPHRRDATGHTTGYAADADADAAADDRLRRVMEVYFANEW